jgi:uncharacterized protein YbjT (DUF2867 family)
MPKTALLFGATGMIGTCLLDELLNDAGTETVKVFLRKSLIRQHPKLKQILTDFHTLEAIQAELKGDALYCCLGTTTKQTPSKEGRRFVDYEIPVQLAQMAETNGLPSFLIVSSIGASAQSGNFYLRNKGEMEEKIAACHIPQVVFMQPSFLMGERKEHRAGEGLATGFMRLVSPLLSGSWRKYKPVQGRLVAAAMLALTGKAKGVTKSTYDDIVRAASKTL